MEKFCFKRLLLQQKHTSNEISTGMSEVQICLSPTGAEQITDRFVPSCFEKMLETLLGYVT